MALIIGEDYTLVENVFFDLDEIVVVITWIILYIFIFEIEGMRNKFESDSPEQH